MLTYNIWDLTPCLFLDLKVEFFQISRTKEYDDHVLILLFSKWIQVCSFRRARLM